LRTKSIGVVIISYDLSYWKLCLLWDVLVLGGHSKLGLSSSTICKMVTVRPTLTLKWSSEPRSEEANSDIREPQTEGNK